MRLIPGVDYFLCWRDFPEDNGTDGGATTENPDGTYTVFMDNSLLWNKAKARKVWRHEENHVLNDDFHNGKPISEIEDI